MTYLGLDLGTRRVGVAVSDPDGRVAVPVVTVERQPGTSLAAALRPIVDEHHVDVLVVGLPLRTGGEEGPEAQAARAEGSRLQTSLNLPVRFYDERFTTRIVGDAMRALGTGRRPSRKRNRSVDMLAAAVILQGYLDRRARGHPGEAAGNSPEQQQ